MKASWPRSQITKSRHPHFVVFHRDRSTRGNDSATRGIEIAETAVYDLSMTTRIKAPFATAQRTADVLGVSKSRFKVLERLAHVNTIFGAKTSRDVDAVGKGSAIYFEKSARPK